MTQNGCPAGRPARAPRPLLSLGCFDQSLRPRQSSLPARVGGAIRRCASSGRRSESRHSRPSRPRGSVREQRQPSWTKCAGLLAAVFSGDMHMAGGMLQAAIGRADSPARCRRITPSASSSRNLPSLQGLGSSLRLNMTPPITARHSEVIARETALARTVRIPRLRDQPRRHDRLRAAQVADMAPEGKPILPSLISMPSGSRIRIAS